MNWDVNGNPSGPDFFAKTVKLAQNQPTKVRYRIRANRKGIAYDALRCSSPNLHSSCLAVSTSCYAAIRTTGDGYVDGRATTLALQLVVLAWI